MRALVLAAFLVLPPPPLAGAQPSPYAGQETREIRSLSAQEVEDLLAGRGMGLARAAELNHFPGPMHVLELRDRLGLTAAQEEAVRSSFARMQAAARALGAALVDAERALDRGFAELRVTPESLAEQTAATAALQGELRAVHLLAHVETRALLTPAQIAAYDEARGYAAAPGAVLPPEGHGRSHQHRRPSPPG